MRKFMAALCAALLLIMQAAVVLAAELPPQVSVWIDEALVKINATQEQHAAAKPIIERGVSERIDILKKAGVTEGTKPSMFTLMRLRQPMKDSRAKTQQQLAEVLNPRQMSQIKQVSQEMSDKLIDRIMSGNF